MEPCFSLHDEMVQNSGVVMFLFSLLHESEQTTMFNTKQIKINAMGATR